MWYSGYHALKPDTPMSLPKIRGLPFLHIFCVAELTPGSKSFHSYLSNESCIQSYSNYTNKVHIYKHSLVALTNKMAIIWANNLTIFKIFIWTEKCTHGIVVAWDMYTGDVDFITEHAFKYNIPNVWWSIVRCWFSFLKSRWVSKHDPRLLISWVQL